MNSKWITGLSVKLSGLQEKYGLRAAWNVVQPWECHSDHTTVRESLDDVMLGDGNRTREDEACVRARTRRPRSAESPRDTVGRLGRRHPRFLRTEFLSGEVEGALHVDGGDRGAAVWTYRAPLTWTLRHGEDVKFV